MPKPLTLPILQEAAVVAVPPVPPEPPRPAAEAGAERRLVIEEDAATGAFVYKTLDRVTGEVISQMPREEVLKLRESADYAPGQVIDSRS